MFTNQASQLRAKLLQAEGNWPQAVDALIAAIGQCAQVLEHRGPVTFGGPDPPNAHFPDSILNQEITEEYALNLAEGSHANFQGDSIFAGDVYNVNNTTNNYSTTENYEGDSTVNYGGNTIITFGPNVTLIFEGDSNCRDLVTEVTPTEAQLDYIESVTLQSTVVTSVSLQETVVTDVDFDEETCELTVTTAGQSYLDASQSYQAGSVDYISDVDATVESIAVLGDCDP